MTPELAPGHGSRDAQKPSAGGDTLPDLAPGQSARDAQTTRAGGITLHDPDLAPGHQTYDAQVPVAGGNQPTPGQRARDTQSSLAGGDQSAPGQPTYDAQVPVAGRNAGDAERELAELLLRVASDALDGLERERVATGNRLESLRRVKGMAGTAVEAELEALHAGLLELEHDATLALQRALRRHPLGPWVKRTVGVGEKQGARLLAAIGDPAARPNPAKLWQYCGHGDPARSRLRKGAKVEHNPTAKMRVRLVAESCMKHRHSPYRAVYDCERAKWAERDTTDGHRHAHALRIVGKAILLDLWREARAIDLSAPTLATPALRVEPVPARATVPATPMPGPPAQGDPSRNGR
jgi:hypothetical protein